MPERTLFQTHRLKMLPEFFEAVMDLRKTFEVRLDDRGFRVGDILLFEEWDGEAYTGTSTSVSVSYIHRGGAFGIQEGWVCMGFEGWFQDRAMLAAPDLGFVRLPSGRCVNVATIRMLKKGPNDTIKALYAGGDTYTFAKKDADAIHEWIGTLPTPSELIGYGFCQPSRGF